MEPINYKTLGEYTYFEGYGEYYYISDISIIIDNKKNILLDSNILLTYDPNYLIMATKFVNDIDLTTSNYSSYENIICILHWFNTYGHFKDELFNLYNFYKLFDKNNFTALMNYKQNHGILPIGYSFDNYDKIKDLLFDSNHFINASNLNNNIIKINNLVLIKHEISSPMFHMFPKNVVNKILYKINNDNSNNDNFNKNVFITRGKALHMPRNLDNQQELEEHFLSINYNVINPEIMDIERFIKNIQNAENIFITWGGAMVNLCYVNPNTNIYLLQSLSYKDEYIFHVFNFLKSYKNLYLIKCNDENKINMKDDMKNAIKLT